MQSTSQAPILNQLAGRPELLGGGLGGALGGTQGETPEERARNALLGAAGGAIGGRLARGAAIDQTRMGSNLGNVPKPVQKAQAQGYEGADIGEAQEWVSARSKGLDMSQTARMQRAKEQGFIVDLPLYHGTAATVESFDPTKFGSATNAKSAKLGVWLTSSPYTAAGYAKLAAEDAPVSRILKLAEDAEQKGNFDEAEALNRAAEAKERDIAKNGGRGANIMPIYVRGRFKTVDMEGAKYDPTDTPLTKLAQQAKKEGFEGLRLQNFSDEGGWGRYNPTDHVLVFNPSNIRSVNAAFDPAKSSSANILATPPELGGAFVGGALGGTQGETPEERARNALLGAAGGAVGGRLASRAAIDRTRMGSNLGNVPKPVQEAQEIIPTDLENEMMQIYKKNIRSEQDEIKRFVSSDAGNKYYWNKVTEEDLIDMIDPDEDVNAVYPEAMKIIRRDGSAIQYGTDSNIKFASEKNAPTEKDFFAEAASEEGWIKPKPSTIDDIWQMGVDEYAASQVMEYLAKKEGWNVTPVRGSYRYQTLSKDVPGGTIYLNVRVSDHAKQSAVGHAIHGKDDIDINLAPSTGDGNEQYGADDFKSMIAKLRAAEKRGPQTQFIPLDPSNILATPPELGGAFVGGALGGTQGETPEERARNALLGAAGGAIGGRLASRTAIDRTRMGSNLGNVLTPQPQGPKVSPLGFYSELENAVARPNTPGKATGEAWAAWLKSQPGVKAEELETTGVTDWLRAKQGQVSRAEVENYVRNNGVQVEEITKTAQGENTAAVEGVRNTKFSNFTLPGGKGYTELVLKLPLPNRPGFEEYLRSYREQFPNANTTDAEVRGFHNQGVPLPARGAQGFQRVETKGDVFRSSHWDEPNVLAHVRFKERTGPNGQRILALEEVQSDWHQAGRKRGYGKTQKTRTFEVVLFPGHANPMPIGYGATKEEALNNARNAGWSDYHLNTSQTREIIRETENIRGVPDAPFKDNKWAALAMKRVMKYAADNGFDGVAWIPGNIQNGKFHNATDKRADFYDKILVNIANEIGKKSGAKAERMPFKTMPISKATPISEITGTTDFHYMPLTPELRKKAVEQGFPLFSVGAVGAGASMISQDQKKPPGQRPRG
jgi:hypothetical protein